MAGAGRGTENLGDPIEALIDFMEPSVVDVLGRLEGDEFTTEEFIALLLTDPVAAAAYHEALRRWGEGERYGKMVVHGQVIPAILRRSNRVEWAGYAHGEADAFGVPAWWRPRPTASADASRSCQPPPS